MEMRDVSTKIPLSEVPFVMRAMGFYPSEQEVLLFFVNTYIWLHKDTVISRYLKVKVHLKLLVSQSKFSGSLKFTLKYQ